MPLPVAHATVVEAGVTRNDAERVVFAEITAVPADDDCQLSLVIVAFGNLGPDHRLIVADLRAGKAHEYGRVLGLVAPGLDSMGLVVETHAKDFARIGYRWQEFDVEAGIDGFAVGGSPYFVQGISFENRSQIGIFVAKRLVTRLTVIRPSSDTTPNAGFPLCR